MADGGAAAAGSNEIPAELADLAADGAASGAAAGFIDEAPHLTGAPPAPPPAVEAPQTPRGPFTDEEWERRQGLKRRAERDASHALAPLQKWMVEETMLRHQQHDMLEHIKLRLQTALSALDTMERQTDRLREEVRELKQQRTGPAAASDED